MSETYFVYIDWTTENCPREYCAKKIGMKYNKTSEGDGNK